MGLVMAARHQWPLVFTAVGFLLGTAGQALAQVSAGGLGTRVNGTAQGRCLGGLCSIQGGLVTGPNLFHRLGQFDTRSRIQRVDLETRGRANVVVGVAHPAGSFFGAPLRLSAKANLFWLSPGGIWLGKGSRFLGATNLLLSTAPSMRFGSRVFAALADPPRQVLRLDQAPSLDLERLADGGVAEAALGAGSGPIVLAGGRLIIERHLVLDSGRGPILSASSGGRTVLQAGSSVRLAGGRLHLSAVDLRAGTSSTPGLVTLSAGVNAGGLPDVLQLEAGALRGARILLEGAGGVELRQVDAQTVAPAGGETMVRLTAGTESRPAAANLQDVRLDADTILLRATGSLAAERLQAHAASAPDAGLLQLEAGMEGQAAVIGGGMRLQTAALRGGTVVLRAPGPLHLEDTQLEGRQLVVQATGDLQATDLRATASGTRGEQGTLWLLSERPRGQNSGGAVAVRGARLQADQVVARAAGDLALMDLSLSARGGAIWLLSDAAEGGREGRARLEAVTLKGREMRLRAGHLELAHSTLTAPGEKGLIQLEALRLAENGEGGRLALRGSRLDGQVIVARATGSLDLRQVAAQAGPPGRRGLIQLESAPASSSRGRQGTTNARLEGVDLRARRIVVDAGSIQVLAHSRLEAPKGMIHLQARQADLDVNHSTLDVGVKELADLRAPVSTMYEIYGTVIADETDEPSIGLFAAKDLRLANQSKILASQKIDALRQSHPNLRRTELQLTNTSGVVVGDAGKDLSVSNSLIAADASDNLAGNVILRAQGSGETEGLNLTQARISASGGAGSGDLRFSSANGMRLRGSSLTAQSSQSPADPQQPSQADWSNFPFSGGEITLTNSSTVRPIRIVDSSLRAEHAASGGLRFPGVLDGTDAGLDFPLEFADEFDDNDVGSIGGVIHLISSGGLILSGQKTVVSVDSKPRVSGPLEGLGGTIRLVNLSSRPTQIRGGAQISAKVDVASPSIPINLRREGDVISHEGPLQGSFQAWGSRGANPYLLRPDHPSQDGVITGGPGKGLPQKILERRKATPNDLVVLRGAPPLDLRTLRGSPARVALTPPAPAPVPRPELSRLETTVAPAAPDPPRVVPVVSLSGPVDLAAPAPSALSPLIVKPSQPLAESTAVEAFLSAEQAFSQQVNVGLGLDRPVQPTPGLAFLQQLLRQAIARRPSSSAEVAVGREYTPAILQISSSSLPAAGLDQITHVLIPAKGPIQGWQTHVDSLGLKEAIRRVQHAFSQQAELDVAGSSGEPLAAALLAPVLPELERQGINALILSVDRGLQGIPFAALPVSAGSLVDKVAITITPSLGLADLRLDRDRPSGQRTLLAGASRFANGLAPLPMAPRELQELAALHPGALLLLNEAFHARSLVEQARRQPIDILHLATHADFVNQSDHRARIYTSDGELSLQELGRQLHRKPAHSIGLFVLNACRTAIGNEERELGIAGLALQAGANSALGNLWFVDDVVSAAFSVQFHRALQQGLRKDQALQQTQQRFREGSIFVQGDQIRNSNHEILISGLTRADQLRLQHGLTHPYFWAGVLLSGSPW